MITIKTSESYWLQRDEIELHEDSVEYLEKAFNHYQDAEMKSNTAIKNPIIHMYAYGDTRDINGVTHGYHDSLFFNVFIYDSINNLRYSAKLKDSVNVGETGLYNTSIFKDGSTLLKFHGDHRFELISTVLCVFKVGSDTKKTEDEDRPTSGLVDSLCIDGLTINVGDIFPENNNPLHLKVTKIDLDDAMDWNNEFIADDAKVYFVLVDPHNYENVIVKEEDWYRAGSFVEMI